MFELAVDLISFYSIFKNEAARRIHNTNIDRCFNEARKKNIDVEIVNTGSAFEDFYLPYMEGKTLNVDGDHMIIRNDITVCVTGEQNITKEEQWATEISKEEPLRGEKIVSQGEQSFFDTEQHNTFFKRDVLYMHQGCHKGYVFLSKEKCNDKIEHNESLMKENCFSANKFVAESRILFNPRNLVPMGSVGQMTGPAFYLNGNVCIIVNRDFVFALKCNLWPDQAREWITRKRSSNWPSEKQIKNIESSGCFIVPVASHRNSRLRDYEWRLSFSRGELELVETIPENVKLVYALLKALIKRDMKKRYLTVFASYHLKTCLLWFIERFGLKEIKQWRSEKIMHDLLEFLIAFYIDSSVPNFFVRDNNMIDHRSETEIKQCVSALYNLKRHLLLAIMNYIDICHKLPIEFDETFAGYFNSNNRKKICQLMKYNFMLMKLHYELRAVADLSCTHINDKLLQKAKHLHRTDNNIDISNVSEMGETTDDHSIDDILELLSEYLECDELSITEKSGVALGVFNLVLLGTPNLLLKKRKEKKKGDLDEYVKKCSVFVNVLHWASLKHELYANAIYEFLVEKWVNGPNFVSCGKDAFMKLLMVTFGEPTKQSKGVTGSLVRQKKDGEIFMIYRSLAYFLLSCDSQLAYVAYQGVAWVVNGTLINEFWMIIKYDHWDYNKIRAIKLVMRHEKLKDALTDKQKSYIQKIQREIDEKIETKL